MKSCAELPNDVDWSCEGMVLQADTQLHQYLQGAERAVFLTLYRGHRYKKSTVCLMSIKQWEEETLRSYIIRFNKEAFSIDEADDKILVVAFTNGLRKEKFMFFLYRKNPKTMLDVLYRATKYMNAEDTLLAGEEKPKKRKDKRTHGKIGDGRWLGSENEGRTNVPNHPLGGSQALPH